MPSGYVPGGEGVVGSHWFVRRGGPGRHGWSRGRAGRPRRLVPGSGTSGGGTWPIGPGRVRCGRFVRPRQVGLGGGGRAGATRAPGPAPLRGTFLVWPRP